MSAEVRFTRVKKHGGALLSKRIFLNGKGEVQSDGAPCAMGRGTATRVRLNGAPAAGLAAQIVDLGSSEALVAGDLADGLTDTIRIERDGLADPARGTHSRTRKTFTFRPGHPALALLDFDQKAMPGAVAERLAAIGGFEGALASLLPGYAALARVVRASTSAGLFNAVTGERYAGRGGIHIYLFAAGGADIPRFLETLQKRAWLAGLGWIMVGKRGQLLIRSIVDASVGQPEGLMFEGPPLVVHPLAQDHEARRPTAHEGELLDTRAACPPLTAAEQREFDALVAAAKQAAKPDAAAATERAAEELAQDRGLDLETARSVIRSSLKGELVSLDVLHFDDDRIGQVTVAEVLADPGRFHGQTLADPLEGRAYGRGKARVYRNADGTIVINTFAHGCAVYRLRHGRSTIKVIGGQLHSATREASDALGKATLREPGKGVFRRGSLLMRPSRVAAPELGGITRTHGALVLTAIDVHYLRLVLTAHVRWQRFDKRSEDWVDIDAPAAVAQALLAAGDTWAAVPRLTGIVEAPTLRPDGTVLERPGYDADTGLLFDPGEVVFPSVPPRPTRGQALAALDTLGAVYRDFPFRDEESRSVALCTPITTLVRKAVRAAPMHVHTAPKMACGKTLLATVPSYIATGRAPAMMSQTDDPESERKRLLALLLEGLPMIVIDNVDRPLRSDALCSILTEPLFTDRLLGVSKTVTVPTNSTFVCTGNNISIAGDLSARAIVCELDPQVERPEERQFDVDLHRYVPEHRAELATAVLTIVRAYLAAGAPCPKGLPVFGRYEQWSRLVREPLVWLGMADPCLTRRKLEVRDPVREQLGNLLVAWRAAFGDSQQTVGAAVLVSEQQTGAYDAPVSADIALREAMDAVAGERGSINTRRLGNFMAKHERRIEQGLRFVRGGNVAGGIVQWAARTCA